MPSRRRLGLARAAALALAVVVAGGACSRAPAPQAATASARSTAVIRREGNHLVGQPSPYLQQHAHNPVDWYPWGDEALDRARREGRLIFLSIGYSTCHWCHVMERESFEDDETARYLNDGFVAIKVDREARPDLDALFLEAVAGLGGSTGWPLTVVLTPDLEPLFGGTYFPRVSGGPGRPALLDMLREITARFHAEGPALAQRGRELYAEIDRRSREAGGAGVEVDEPLLRAAFARVERARDATYGGFGAHQKFPDTPLLLAELRWFERTGDAAARAHLVLTLEQMMRGGIHDHLTGTFHRYATDRAWHVPHFERMLYDNAQLAALYLEAGRALDREDLALVGRAAAEDLVASWQRPDGGLVVGFDADDPRGEGAYYTFTPAELAAALGAADGRVVGAAFGVTAAGERALGGRSVLHRVADDAALAQALGIEPGAIAAAVARARPTLRALRDARPAPAVDDKELAAWNGLALMTLADAGRWLGEPRFVEAARRVAGFLVDRCWQPGSRSMLRGRWRDAPLGEGYLDDYALPALGLLRLHAADGDLRWLVAARALADAILERFHDEATGALLHAAPPALPRAAGPLPLARPDADDGVLPSGSAAATLLLLELGALTGDAALRAPGERALRAEAGRLRDDPFASGFLLVAADHASAKVHEVVIAGAPGDPRTEALLRELAAASDARTLVVRLPREGADAALVKAFPAFEGKRALGDRPTAFVCKLGACDAPAFDPAALRRSLATF